MTAVERLVVAHTACAVALFRDDAHDLDEYIEAMGAVLKEQGVDAFKLISRRAEMGVRELLAGQEPKLAQLDRDPLPVLEACRASENVVREFRAQGVQPSPDRKVFRASRLKFTAALKAWHREHRRHATAERHARSIGRTEDETEGLKRWLRREIAREASPIHAKLREAEFLRWAGTWQAKTPGYVAGRDVVTRGGGMWLCRKSGTLLPPGGSGDWTLVCKAGRDGKDAPSP